MINQNKMTAVEKLIEKITLKKVDNQIYLYPTISIDDCETARVIEQQQMIEFACKVAEVSAKNYIQGKTTWQIAEELLTIKSE